MCKERMKGLSCSLSAEHAHDVHVALSADGILLGRWRMVAEELPLSGAIPPPEAGGDLYGQVL